MSELFADPATLLPNLLFYALSTVLLFSGLMVITARNPVHSVLFLILAFFNASGLFLLLGAEFVAMTLIIVYVGAVAVLFLFVVMMLDVDFRTLRQGVVRQLPLAILVGGILLLELAMMLVGWNSVGAVPATSLATLAAPAGEVTNAAAIGSVLYTDYLIPFQLAGLVLLVAMIGAIVLTLREREGVRRQNVTAQIARKPSDVLRINKTNQGGGQ